MKTNKRSFWLTLALVAVCACTAFVFVGCNDTDTPPAPHEHSYTEWHHTDTEHWRECPDDGAATEKSKHTFVDGKCECGLVDTRAFGSVTGKITLRGGKAPNDYGGVAVDFEGDDVNVSIDENGNFTASHVTVGKDYNVTVSKEGYSSYTAFVGLDTEGETVALATPFTLEYKRFDFWVGYDKAEHDFSQVNDENPTIGNNGKTLNVITRDTYGDVAVSLWVKPDNVTGYATQGIFVEFEDGKNVQAAYSKSGWANNGLMWFVKTSDWGKNAIYESKQNVLAPVSDDQNALLTSADGLKVTILRKGEMVYIFANNVLVNASAKALPDGYADDIVKVGFFTFNPSAANASWKFDIEEDVSSYAIPNFDVPDEITVENGAISFDKESYLYGERATITVTPDDGYVLGELKVNNKSVSTEVENNEYSFAVMQNITVSATFIPSTQFDSVAFMTPAEANANGLKITLSRDGESDKVGIVQNNAFTVRDIKPGLWQAKTTQYGVEVALKDVFVSAETVTLDMSGVFASASAVNFGNEKTYSGGNETFYTVPANISGDAYFGMKLKCATDITTAKEDSVQFGLQLFYEGQGEASMRLTVKNNEQLSDGYYKMQQSNLWDEETVAGTYVDALKKDGLYVVVYREADTGNVYVYYGTSKSNIVKSNKVYGNGDKKKGNIIKFGAGFWGGNYAATISDLMYGKTLAEALGEQVTPIAVTGAGDVKPGETKQGSIAVSESNVYEDVTVTITTEDGFKLSGFTVNGKAVGLTDLTSAGNGVYTYTLRCYTGSTLAVGATFTDCLLCDVELTVDGHKMGEYVLLNGEVTLTNTMDKNDVRTGTLANGKITVEKMVTPATYTVSFDTNNYYEGTVTLEKGTKTASVSLEYKRFVSWYQWGSDLLDFSEVNNEGPNLKFKDTNKTDQHFNVITRDTYGNAAASMWVKKGRSYSSGDNQGICIKFVDKQGNDKYMILSLENTGNNVYKIIWSKNYSANGTFTTIKDSWIEFQRPMTATQESTAASNDGIKITIVRIGKMLYPLIDDTLIQAGVVDLGDDYADGLVQFCYYVPNCKGGSSIKFDIHTVDGIDSETFTNFTFKVDPAFNANGKTVTLSRDGETSITGTIENNAFTVPSIKGGLWTAQVNITVFGASTSVVTSVWIESSTSRHILQNVFKSSGMTTEDLAAKKERKFAEDYTVATNIAGDAWFVSKIAIDNAIDRNGKDVRLGFDMYFGGNVGESAWNNESAPTLKFNGTNWYVAECGKTFQESGKMDTAYVDALYGEGLYLAAFRQVSSGNVDVYVGTKKSNLTKVITFNALSDLHKQNVTRFGIRFWNEGGQKYFVSATETMYYDSAQAFADAGYVAA